MIVRSPTVDAGVPHHVVRAVQGLLGRAVQAGPGVGAEGGLERDDRAKLGGVVEGEVDGYHPAYSTRGRCCHSARALCVIRSYSLY